jgi:hypothetical protein
LGAVFRASGLDHSARCGPAFCRLLPLVYKPSLVEALKRAAEKL